MFYLQVRGEQVLIIESTGQEQEYRKMGRGFVLLSKGSIFLVLAMTA